MRFNIPYKSNKKLEKLVKAIEKNIELHAYWKCSNITAIDRLGYSDHGPIHVIIVANAALRMLRILVKHKVIPSIVKNYKLENDDAEIVVVLASILHDVGMSIHREKHDEYSMVIGFKLLNDLLDEIYDDEKKAIIISEVLHAMILHDQDIKPLTIEGGIFHIADALDMSKGRSRIPFETGTINIHSVSARAIDSVEIKEGKKKPIEIIVKMNNSAGIFQVDNLLKPRIERSGLGKYVGVIAEVKGKEKRIVKRVEI